RLGETGVSPCAHHGGGREMRERPRQPVDAPALVVERDQRAHPGAAGVDRLGQPAELCRRADVALEEDDAAGRGLGEEGARPAARSLSGSGDVRARRGARGGSQAHFVAEAAIAEALQRVNAPGVVNFQNDVVGQWAGLWGAGTHTFGPVSGCTYTVTPVASATDPTNAGRLIATANGRESVHNVVVANVVRSDIPSTAPGAIYLANDQATNATFKGDSFSIDGNDHNYTGGAGSAPPVPGLSTPH